jgi:hypothetical protein
LEEITIDANEHFDNFPTNCIVTATKYCHCSFAPEVVGGRTWWWQTANGKHITIASSRRRR